MVQWTWSSWHNELGHHGTMDLVIMAQWTWSSWYNELGHHGTMNLVIMVQWTWSSWCWLPVQHLLAVISHQGEYGCTTTIQTTCFQHFTCWLLMVSNEPIMLTPNSQGTWDWLTTKKWPNSGLLGSRQGRMFLLCYQKVISYSSILAVTRAYTPLKLTSSTTTFNRQKRSGNLSISLASDPTRSWVLLWSQVFAG